MVGQIHHSLSARAWRLVERQHGVITREQLLGLGFHRRSIEHRIAIGRLHPVMAGVYAVGRPQLTRHGRWMAAVLSCGSEAALSHRSAAALWGFGVEVGRRIEITVRSGSARRRPGVRISRRPGLAESEVDVCEDIPATRPVRTLLDLAADLDPARLERCINEADRLSLTNPEALREALNGYRGVPGVARLRELLDRRTFRLTRSDLERKFLSLATVAGLPNPVTGKLLNGFEVDFWWPDLNLVVETDGLRYHRTPAQQARDRLRDQTHIAKGLTPLRFTHEQIHYEPDHVIEVLNATIAAFKGE